MHSYDEKECLYQNCEFYGPRVKGSGVGGRGSIDCILKIQVNFVISTSTGQPVNVEISEVSRYQS